MSIWTESVAQSYSTESILNSNFQVMLKFLINIQAWIFTRLIWYKNMIWSEPVYGSGSKVLFCWRLNLHPNLKSLATFDTFYPTIASDWFHPPSHQCLGKCQNLGYFFQSNPVSNYTTTYSGMLLNLCDAVCPPVPLTNLIKLSKWKDNTYDTTC